MSLTPQRQHNQAVLTDGKMHSILCIGNIIKVTNVQTSDLIVMFGCLTPSLHCRCVVYFATSESLLFHRSIIAWQLDHFVLPQ